MYRLPVRYVYITLPAVRVEYQYNTAISSERKHYTIASLWKWVFVHYACSTRAVSGPVAAPGRQGSQVISRSLRLWGRSSGANASAVKLKFHMH